MWGIQVRLSHTDHWREPKPSVDKMYAGFSVLQRFARPENARKCAVAYKATLSGGFCVRVIRSGGEEVFWSSEDAAVNLAVETNFPFRIELHARNIKAWRNIHGHHVFSGWDASKPFPRLDAAIACAKEAEKHWTTSPLRVIRIASGTVYWQSKQRPKSDAVPAGDNEPETAGGEHMAPDINKPLTIPRLEVVKRLEEHLAEEVKKREDAIAAEEKSREETLAAIAKFTPDELYNLFYEVYTVTAKDITFDQENKSYVTTEAVPTKLESDLEKFVRVLKMAKDESIEVTPSQELYRLL